MTLRFSALTITVCVLLGSALAPSLCTSARAAPAVDADSELVVLDRLEVHGSTDSPAGFLETYGDLPLGTSMAPGALQDHLAKFKLRLEALSYFKSVDLHLERGQVRNHYIVVIDLEIVSPYYGGVGASAYRGKRNLPVLGPLVFTMDGDGREARAFAGSRNIAGTGLMADLELRHFDVNARDGYIKGLAGDVITASLFHPAIAHSPYSLGVQVAEGKTATTFQFGAYQNRVNTVVDTYAVDLGRRFGLNSISLVGGRSAVRMLDTLFNFNTAVNYVGLRDIYSEKSFLAAVEPGTVVKFAALRTVRDDTTFPLINLSVENTQLFASHQAITPRFQAVYSYDYQLSILYQWISPWNWAFGLQPLAVAGLGTKPGYGFGLSAKYVTPSFFVDLSLSVGTQSFDDGQTVGRHGVAQ